MKAHLYLLTDAKKREDLFALVEACVEQGMKYAEIVREVRAETGGGIRETVSCVDWALNKSKLSKSKDVLQAHAQLQAEMTQAVQEHEQRQLQPQ